jgi:hypothetical protein
MSCLGAPHLPAHSLSRSNFCQRPLGEVRVVVEGGAQLGGLGDMLQHRAGGRPRALALHPLSGGQNRVSKLPLLLSVTSGKPRGSPAACMASRRDSPL